MTVTCSVCAGPYAAVSDDPSPAHPSCAPSEPARFEAATRGVRVYTGRGRPAVHDAGCRGCGGRIAVGELLNLADLPDGRAWVHVACDPAEQSNETAPQGALSGPVRPENAPSRLPVTPARRDERHGHDTTAPRRAAA